VWVKESLNVEVDTALRCINCDDWMVQPCHLLCMCLKLGTWTVN
jgi:hypothetical protein